MMILNIGAGSLNVFIIIINIIMIMIINIIITRHLLRAHRISSQRAPSSPDLCPMRRGRTDTLDGISTLSGNNYDDVDIEYDVDDGSDGEDEDTDHDHDGLWCRFICSD